MQTMGFSHLVVMISLFFHSFLSLSFHFRPTLSTPLSNTHSSVERFKRDETENNRGAYGRGIAFYVGEPCEDQCNRILFHVFCNLTSHQCACLPEYPVNVDNTVCAQALRLGETCEYDASCRYLDANSICEPEERKCRCDRNHYAKVDPIRGPVCIKAAASFSFAGKGIYAIAGEYELLTAISATSSLLLFIILLILLIYRMYSKSSRLNRSLERLPTDFVVRNCSKQGSTPLGGRAESISPFLLLDRPLPTQLGCSSIGSRRASMDSVDQLAPPPPPFRSASISALAPAPGAQFLSRRPSLSSIPSSFRSCSSLPSQTSAYPIRPMSCTLQSRSSHLINTDACNKRSSQRLLNDSMRQSSPLHGHSMPYNTAYHNLSHPTSHHHHHHHHSNHQQQQQQQQHHHHHPVQQHSHHSISHQTHSIMAMPANNHYDNRTSTTGQPTLHTLSRSANSVLPTTNHRSTDPRDASTGHITPSSSNYRHVHPTRVVWDEMQSRPSQRTASTELLNQYLGNYFPADVQQDMSARHANKLHG